MSKLEKDRYQTRFVPAGVPVDQSAGACIGHGCSSLNHRGNVCRYLHTSMQSECACACECFNVKMMGSHLYARLRDGSTATSLAGQPTHDMISQSCSTCNLCHLGSHLQHLQLHQLRVSCIKAHCLALCVLQHLHACACGSPPCVPHPVRCHGSQNCLCPLIVL